MCGRYGYYHSRKEMGELLVSLGVQHPLPEVEPRYNVAPTDEMPVVRMEGETPVLERMRWGLVPFWAPDLKVGSQMINARCETIREKPAFREAVRTRRCLVPASGFYEWLRLGPKAKQPVHIRRSDGRPLVFAGLWEEWGPREQPVRTYTVVTTSANKVLERIHDRMPVILSEQDARAWLRPDTPVGTACELLRPCPPEWLEAFAVNSAVNRAGYDSPDCLDRPAPPAPSAQASLPGL
jgi:putative SOS response-associated peptidase YedK